MLIKTKRRKDPVKLNYKSTRKRNFFLVERVVLVGCQYVKKNMKLILVKLITSVINRFTQRKNPIK